MITDIRVLSRVDSIPSASPSETKMCREVCRKIRAFGELAEGWHFGEGSPISEVAIDTALKLIGFADEMGLYKFDAFPGLEGEVILTFYGDNEELDFTVHDASNIEICAERAGGDELETDGNLQAAKSRLREFWNQEWKSSDFSTVNIGNLERIDSKKMLSKTTKVESLSFPWSVFRIQNSEFASILQNTILV